MLDAQSWPEVTAVGQGSRIVQHPLGPAVLDLGEEPRIASGSTSAADRTSASTAAARGATSRLNRSHPSMIARPLTAEADRTSARLLGTVGADACEGFASR